MVHAVRIRDGKASFCNRWVRTSRLEQEERAGWALHTKSEQAGRGPGEGAKVRRHVTAVRPPTSCSFSKARCTATHGSVEGLAEPAMLHCRLAWRSW